MPEHGWSTQMAVYTGGSPFPMAYEEWERRARQVLPNGPFDYIAGGAGGEYTMQANRAAFGRWAIRPQMLVDVAQRDHRITLLGQTLPAPFMLAPIGNLGIVHQEAEMGMARAAADQGIPFVLSTVSSHPMEAVAAVAGNSPRWFQLYWGIDADVTQSLLRRAEAAGYSAVVATFDRAVRGWRERDLRHRFLPYLKGDGMANYLTDPTFRSKLAVPPEQDMQAAIAYFLRIFFNPSLTWRDLAHLRRMTKLPIILKGVVSPDDAQRALDAGVSAIYVSNHGGRHLDGAIATLDALPEVVSTVKRQVPVLVDSGIRRGPDIVKALCLGADAVLIGRPYVYGLAVGGAAGVAAVLRHLIADFDIALANTGRRRVRDLDASSLVRVAPY